VDRTILEPVADPALIRFAERLRIDLDAEHVLLFGSYADGQPRPDSDYDLIIVSPRFADIDLFRRGIGLRHLWYDVGGDKPLDLICLTPTEFEQEQRRISLIATVLPETVELLSS
jgi:predicted nucleotidyltransferase